MDESQDTLGLSQDGGGTTPPLSIPSADDINEQLRRRKLGAAAPAESTHVASDPAARVRPSIAPLPAKEPGWGERLSNFAKKVTGSVARGVTDAVDNASNTTVATGAGIVNAAIKGARATGIANSHFGSDWEQWYNAGHIADINPLQIGEDNKDALFGQKQDGLYGFIEDATAFTTGFLATGAAMKGAGLAASALESGTAKALAHTAQGALTDAAFMDPYKKRLSNLIQNAPDPIQYAITNLLQAKDTDNEAVARLKSSLEGAMTGAAIDRFIGVLGAARGLFKSGGKAAVDAVDEGAARVAEVAAREPEAVQVVPKDDGTLTLKQNGEAAPAADAPVFTSSADAESHAASLNEVVADQQLPRGTVSLDVAKAVSDRINTVRETLAGNVTGAFNREVLDRLGVRGVKQLMSNPQKLSEWITSDLPLNVSFTQSDPEVNAMVSELANQFKEAFAGAHARLDEGLGTTFAELRAGATKLAQEGDPDSWLDSGHADAKITDELMYKQMARRVVVNKLAETSHRLARAFDANPENAIARDNFQQALSKLLNVGSGQEAMASASGRLLGSHRAEALGEAVAGAAKGEAKTGASQAAEVAVADGERIGSANANDLAAAPTTAKPQGITSQAADLRMLARQIVLTEGDPALMIDAMTGTRRFASDPTKWEKFNAYRANAMLSGPRTFFVNALSNAVSAVQMPAEYWLAGVGSRNTALKQQGWEMAAGLFHNWRAAWSAAKRSWSVGSNALDAGASQVGDSGQSVVEHNSSWLGKLFEAPSRALMTTDEFFKNLNYLNAVRGLSVRKSMEQGITDAGEIASRLADDLKTSTTMDGRALNPIALQYARTATFQNPLEYGLGKSWQNLVQEHPALRVITPFVRTPVNLFRFAWQRTPVLGALQRQMMEDIAAGGERRALAVSKQGLGAAVWGTAAWYAHSGNMTGMGPRDPNLRAQWIAAGNQPYSLRVPGTDAWISYRRMDPLGTALGIVSDVVSMSGEMQDHETDDAAAKFIAALSADVMNKTFMSGLSDFMEAVSSGDPHKVQRLAYNLEGSMMPFGSLLRQTNPDDHWREVRGHIDNIASRVPVFSENLEPRRNLLGQPIMKPPGYLNAALNPFTVTFGSDVNPITDELVQLGKSMSMPSPNENGVDLTDRKTWRPTSGKYQSPYDRWLELLDKPKYGKPLAEQLQAIMQTDTWKNATSGSDYYPGGLKYRLASTIIQRAQAVARQTMLQEYPDLQRQLIGTKAAQQASLASDSLASSIEQQFGVKH